MLIILKVLILMKFYNSVKYVYKCMCFGNASYPIPVLDTGKGCYSSRFEVQDLRFEFEVECLGFKLGVWIWDLG